MHVFPHGHPLAQWGPFVVGAGFVRSRPPSHCVIEIPVIAAATAASAAAMVRFCIDVQDTRMLPGSRPTIQWRC